MAQTMEQKRAADAWARAQGCSKAYQNLAKSLPALIMNSGLMQVLAYLHEKGGKASESTRHHSDLGEHLRDWLHRQFKPVLPSKEFAAVMPALMTAEPGTFQHITTEALAWLRWARQMAPAAGKQKEQ